MVLGGDVPTQLQALVNGSIQVGILSPPMVIVARDKYKMNILGTMSAVAVPSMSLPAFRMVWAS